MTSYAETFGASFGLRHSGLEQEDLPLDTKLKCTEAVDNHTEERELGEFMDFCDQYIVGDNGMLVDMRFMPRIVEGEIRILLVGPHPVFVVHKKPAEGGDAFSATLFSGAKYTYQKPEEWQELVDMFAEAVTGQRLPEEAIANAERRLARYYR
mgnify:CR=1 FL=1